MNRCDICGKFRKWENLYQWCENYWNYTFDQVDEKDHQICYECMNVVYPEKLGILKNATV